MSMTGGITGGMMERIVEMFDRCGGETYGEHTTQLSHALQCANLAREDGCPDALIAAALLHDIGQLIDDAGNAAERLHIDAHHEVIGAQFLSTYFPAEVSTPVKLHVAAKRYLCAAEPGYCEKLSEASRLSLDLQGGPMTEAAAENFIALPFAQAAIRLRRYDDAGKEPNAKVRGLESYLPLLEMLAS
jgi:phosphonate degradation associated HDIG domain protein